MDNTLHNQQGQKISARQLTALCTVAMISPATQVAPSWAAEMNQAGWLMFLPGLPINFLLIWLMGRLYKKQPDLGLPDIFTKVFGKVLGGSILLIVGVLIPLVMLIFNNRLFAGRFSSTIFPHTPDYLFIVATMALTFFFTRKSLLRTMRVNSIFFWAALGVIVLLFFGSLSSIKTVYLLPISPREYGGLAGKSMMGLAIFGTFSIGGFLSHHVYDRQNLARETRRATGLLFVLLTMILVICLGVLGPSLARRTSYPIFSAIKALTVPEVFERIDAFAITLWIVTDIMLIVLHFMVAINILGKVFNVKEYQRLSGPLHFIVLAMAMLISNNLSAVQTSLRFFVEPVCSALVILSMISLFTVGKIRKIV